MPTLTLVTAADDTFTSDHLGTDHLGLRIAAHAEESTVTIGRNTYRMTDTDVIGTLTGVVVRDGTTYITLIDHADPTQATTSGTATLAPNTPIHRL